MAKNTPKNSLWDIRLTFTIPTQNIGPFFKKILVSQLWKLEQEKKKGPGCIIITLFQESQE